MIEWTTDSTFEVGNQKFIVDKNAGDRPVSTRTCFAIQKGKYYLDIYEMLVGKIRARNILDLGIFQGGSFVFFDKLFAPDNISAIDISPNPVGPLVEYASQNPNRNLHFSTSQADGEKLAQIVDTELENNLDLVVDDASHTYELTRASFEILFPRLICGGTYIIEDWAWAHNDGYQGDDARFAQSPALTNLLFEQIMLLASTRLVSSITVHRGLYIIRKSEIPHPGLNAGNIWDGLKLRGKPMPAI